MDYVHGRHGLSIHSVLLTIVVFRERHMAMAALGAYYV